MFSHISHSYWRSVVVCQRASAVECDEGCFLFFFFKQKTAYEMRISDWSSDVCSSDLMAEVATLAPKQPEAFTSRDYSVSLEPSRKRVKVVFNGEVVAESTRALVLRETRLPPTYYLPREDVAMRFLVPDRKSTRLNSSH